MTTADENRLARLRLRLEAVERMFEDKSRELYLARKDAEAARDHVVSILDTMVGGLWLLDEDLTVLRANPAALAMLDESEADVIGRSFLDCVAAQDRDRLRDAFESGATFPRCEARFGARAVWGLVSASTTQRGETVCIALDVSEQKSLEAQLMQAQKLESIGQLASGIAHEINTPSQFVADNLNFLQGAFSDLLEVARAAAGDGDADAIQAAVDDADLPYLEEEVPLAVEQSIGGMQRIRKIVGSMKAFSHPSGNEKTAFDLNAVVANTVEMCRNEWKYVSTLETTLDDAAPKPLGFPDQIAQVVLNLIVNAAHAVGGTDRGRQGKGRIRVWTRVSDSWAEVGVEDDGTGIPDDVKARIFDPFFTTKDVGKGTGQGLALCHNVVAQRHKGTIAVSSAAGEGTTFTVRIPMAA